MSRIEDALNKAAGLKPDTPSAASPFTPPTLPEPGDSASSNPKEHMLLTITSPYSPVAEEYRKLKEVVIKHSSREGFNNVILVTSAHPREGKTVTSLNLAISLAQEFDYTVLVIDADLRAPSCHEYLGLEAGPGLSDCLEGRATLQDVLVRTGVGRLVLLQAGTPVSNPAELLASNKMRQLIQEFKHRYPDRYIIIDSPPVKLFAETRSLAGMADTSILVVREGETSMDNVAESVVALDNSVLGIVYNGAREAYYNNKSHYYYYYYNQAKETAPGQ